MNHNEIQRIRKIIDEIVIKESDRVYFCTLTFPTPSVSIVEADKLLKRHLDVMRKAFPEVFILSTLAFNRENVGLHYHNIIVSRSQPNDGLGLIKFVNFGNDQTDLMKKIKSDWLKKMNKAFKEEDHLFSKLVHVENAELRSKRLRDYVSREEEKFIPKEWINSKISWLKVRGEKNFLLPLPTSLDHFFAA